MTGFAVYSTTAEPDCLYATGDTDAIDAATTAEMIWTGDRPLDMVVDLVDRRVWWTFEGDRRTKTTRTGHFVAAYDGGADLFEGFAEELRALHESDEWALPYTGDSRSDAGFELWHVSPDVDSADATAFERVVDRLTDGDDQRGSPVSVEMDGYLDALTAVRALDAAGVKCTVGVDSGDDVFHFQHIDAMLVPTGEGNFAVRGSVGGATESLSEERATETASPTDDAPEQRSKGSDVSAGGLTARLAGVVLVGLLGFATYSFFTRQPVQPISGLATFGAFVGSLGAVIAWYATAAVERQSAVARRRLDVKHLLWGPFQVYGGRAILVLTLGTLSGFLFPRVFWELGLLAGRDGFLFGSLATVDGSTPAVLVFVGGLFVVTVTTMWVFARGWQFRDSVPRLLAGFGIYGLCLLLATGLAEAVWYQYVPAI